MPKISKVFELNVTPERFVVECDELEFKELQLEVERRLNLENRLRNQINIFQVIDEEEKSLIKPINSLVMDIASKMSARSENGAVQIKLAHLKKMALEYFGTEDLYSVENRMKLIFLSINFHQTCELIIFDGKLMGSFQSYTTYPEETLTTDYSPVLKIEVKITYTLVPPFTEDELKELGQEFSFSL